MNTTELPPTVSLQPHECWSALRTVDLGRLGFAGEGEQELFPLNFVVDQGSVVIRTSSTSRIGLCLDGRPVAFEADGRAEGVAWSVVVKGRAKPVTGLYESLDAAQLPVHPAQSGSKPRLVRIVPDTITGRRFMVSDPTAWDTALTSAHRSAPE